MPKTKSKLRIEKINSLSELNRIGWDFKPLSDNEIQCRCPVHDDVHPSVTLNTKKNVWKCHASSCQAKGDIVSLLAHIAKCERSTMLVDLSKRYDLQIVKIINPDVIEKYHEKIWQGGPWLTALRERGVTNDLIRKARLGYHDHRITIPVYDMDGRIINVRKYQPGAPGPDKMKNIKGYGALALYQVEQTKYKTIWICGGEIKALVAGSILNKKGIGAVAVTGGEGSWDVKFNSLFKNKIVFICMDIDTSGKIAARKLASFLVYETVSIYILQLPLDVMKYPKGDVNDWVGSEGAELKDFIKLMREAIKFVPDTQEEELSGEVIEVRLSEASSPSYVGKRIKIEAIVAAMDTTPFLVPKEIGVSCTKDQPNCSICNIRPIDPDENTGKMTMIVPSTSSGILEMVNCPKKLQEGAIKTALRIPPCKTVEFTIRCHYKVLDVRLTPQLHITGDNKDHIVQPAFVVKDNVDLNTPYLFSGKVFPHPKSQQAILLLDNVIAAEDNLNSFAPTENELSSLNIFQPNEWTVEGIENKLVDIYSDFEANVTHIFHRHELHLALDLAFHSVLYFDFDGQRQNGWLNCLITGDTSQGKSEASIRLIEHYGLGVRHECKNATTAGLLGGLQQLGNRWFVSWGIIPTHDRRLVILEEIKGTSPEILGQLTDLRSSGIAEISKIERRKAHARTRLVMISNPRSDRPVSAYNFGLEVVKELMGNLEDIRRFDLAIILSSLQVDPEEINRLSRTRPIHPHIYTAEQSRKLILWSWTRSMDQVRLPDETTNCCMDNAIKMCKKYSETVPLVDRGTMRFKLARMGAGLAGRTFSHLENNKDVMLIRPCHIEYIVKYIDEMYGSSHFGYEDYSKAQIFANILLDSKLIIKTIKGTKHPKDLVEQLLHTDEITMADISDWCEIERDSAQWLSSFFVRKHAIYRQNRWYVKTSEFIRLLKKMKLEGIKDDATPFEKDEF